jgi:Capsule polysaccharide biosynthesis protein
MKLLCHVAPWSRDYFECLSRGFDNAAELVLCSGYRKLDQTCLTRLYRSRYSELKVKPDTNISDADRNVIRRCRLLRTLSTVEAAQHVHAIRFAVREMLSDVRPDVFLSQTTDQSLHQILFEECLLRDIPAFGIVQTFVNGYFRVSNMGERHSARTASVDECLNVLMSLEDKSYVPNFIAKQKKNLAKAYKKAWLSNIARVIYFGARRWMTLDFLNYHYWASSRAMLLNHVHLFPAQELGEAQWQASLSQDGRPSIFVPLQFFPEATIDYWVTDSTFIDYERSLLDLLSRLSADFQFVVKEHPGVWGHRHPSLYEKLARVPGLVFCPTNVAAQHCVESCDAVLVWTGSVGFEAALRGKPVLTVTTPYYLSGGRFMKITLETAGSEIHDHIANVNSRPIEAPEKIKLIQYLLDGLEPGRIQIDGSFNRLQSSDLSAALAAGARLRRHFPVDAEAL